MPYEVETLSPASLNKILLVLEDIKLSSELHNRRNFLFYKPEGFVGVTKDEHETILAKLIKYGTIAETPLVSFLTKYSLLRIGDIFFDFYVTVKSQLLKPEIKPETDEQLPEDLKVKFYDEEKRTLAIGNYTIPIAKHEGNNNAHEIMAYIFVDNKENLHEKFYYVDIAEKRFGGEYDGKNKNAHQPYSGACQRINQIVKDATDGKVKEFLDYNHSALGFVRVNPEYL